MAGCRVLGTGGSCWSPSPSLSSSCPPSSSSTPHQTSPLNRQADNTHTHSLQLKDFALCIDWLLVVKFWLYSILIDPLQQYRYSFNFMCKYFLCQSQEILNKISELELKLKHSNALNDQRKADLQEISDKFRKAATTQQILLLARHFSLIEKLCLRVLTRVPNSVA